MMRKHNMVATQTASLLQKIKKGVLDPAEISTLEQTPADQVVGDLRASRYPVTFQERRIGKKWEISLAHTVRAELALRPVPDVGFASLRLLPAYLDCVMLNI